ncbi:dTDP-4-dehydrorhamnose reductase [Chitinophagaceae bacterium IBVUCB2]|nr:dTDP-4-dehydrorhamnose reductase [Chitinophagaceae bacterium IBVUCB2]
MTARPKILVTGSNGQVGKEIKQLESSFPRFEFIFLSREDLPIHHFELLRNFFKGFHPQYLINCAGYTAVDRAETEKELAFQVNAEAVGVMAAVCKEYSTRFIHISTDYVFDGTATSPYKEDALTNPQSVYGASKLQGEQEALKYNPDTIIIRTAWVYSEFGKNFVKTMLKLMSEREEISVVSDQIGSPTYAANLAEVILRIISSSRWKPGIYNYSDEGIISWYEFALAIKEITRSSCRVNPIPSTAYPTPAKRPSYSVLDKTKIQEAFEVSAKDWRSSLALCISRLQ